MKRTITSLLCLALLVVSCLIQAAATRDPAAHFFDETWGDFQEELATAREQGKQAVLIMFELEDCPYCHRMKQTVLNQPNVQDYFKQHFLIFSVDIESDVEVTDFAGEAMLQKDFAEKKNRVRATPVFAFYDLKGKEIRRARMTIASNGPEEFMLLGRYVVEGEFSNMSFTRFKRQQRKAAKGK
ncbi:MAG: thioredoxin family protein [Sedimenticola sp.]